MVESSPKNMFPRPVVSLKLQTTCQKRAVNLIDWHSLQIKCHLGLDVIIKPSPASSSFERDIKTYESQSERTNLHRLIDFIEESYDLFPPRASPVAASSTNSHHSTMDKRFLFGLRSSDMAKCRVNRT